MKVLFLTLLLGAVCAAQDDKAVEPVSELSGEWRAVHFASNNLEKISGKSLFMPYRRYIVFYKKCVIIIYYVYDWLYHTWRPVPICAKLIGPYIYTYKYEGTYRIEFINVSEKGLIAIHVDETGKEPEQVLLFGKENDIDKEDLRKFKEETEKRGISEENIKDLTKPDECVSVA